MLPETTAIPGLSTTSSLHTIENGKLRVMLYNHRRDKVNIGKGTVLGRVEVYSQPLFEVKEETLYRPERPERFIPVSLLKEKSPEEAHRAGQIKEFLREEDIQFDKERLLETLLSYQDVLALRGDTLGVTDLIEHRINIPKDTKIIYIPAYRVAYSQRAVIDQEVEKMIKDGIVEPSVSPWSFPLLVVPKKDRTNRIVVDFRKLNQATTPDPYPMPSMRDLIATIGSKRIYSTLDLQQGFLQIPLAYESRPLTAFSTSHGRYQYRRMPFGLRSSPVTFVRLMDMVLGDLLGNGVYVYIDDLILCTDTIEEHIALLKEVLKRLRKAGLKLKLKKCNFLRSKIEYLGHTLSKEGIQVNDNKILAIKNYPTPGDKKAIKSFLGLASFYRAFIKGFATIASPLTDLLKKTAVFKWGEEQEEAFKMLKDKLTMPPVLAFPDFEQPFYMVTDASSKGIGSCLMQLHGKTYRPIAYYSRKLRPAEKNYSVTDQESLAVIESLKHFRFIIYGNSVTVFTDHAAVLELLKNPHMSGRKARWFLIAQDYDINLRHIPGKQNLIADALSRYPTTAEIKESNWQGGRVYLFNPQPELTKELFTRAQDLDPHISQAKELIRLNQERKDNKELEKALACKLNTLVLEDDILCTKEKVADDISTSSRIMLRRIVPPGFRQMVLNTMHDHPDRAHPGRNETLRITRERFHWKHMYSDVKNYIASCNVCNSYRGSLDKAPLGSYPIPQAPFARVGIDLITNFQVTIRNHKNILVIVDFLTRFVELVPLTGKTAEECATALFDRLFCRYSAPQLILSDNGLEFNNSLVKELCQRLKIEKVNIQPHHPSSNGIVERCNKKVLDAIRHTVQQDPNWDLRLPSVQLTINTKYHEAIKCTPMKALMGYEPRLPQQWLNQPHSTVYSENPIKLRLANFKVIHQKLQENLKLSQEKMIEDHSKGIKQHDYKVGDELYIVNDRREGPGYKLSVKFIGPYKVIDVSEIKVKLVRKDETPFWIHKDRTKRTMARAIDNQNEEELAQEVLIPHKGQSQSQGQSQGQGQRVRKEVQFEVRPQPQHKYSLRSNNKQS